MKSIYFTITLLLLTCLAVLNGQTSKPPPTELAGTWRLVSSEQRLLDGTSRPDPQTGPRGVGYLVYTDTGRICVVVGNPDRAKWQSAQKPTDVEVRAAFDGIVAYTGRYTVNQADQSVVHHIEMDRVPNLVGTDRKRYYTLTGKRLILRAAAPLPSGVQDWTITWERVEK